MVVCGLGFSISKLPQFLGHIWVAYLTKKVFENQLKIKKITRVVSGKSLR